jgi:hypothetical protein
MNVTQSASVDPAVVNAVTEQQLAVALARKARQVEQVQGDAVVQMLEQAAQVSQSLADGKLDVQI